MTVKGRVRTEFRSGETGERTMNDVLRALYLRLEKLEGAKTATPNVFVVGGPNSPPFENAWVPVGGIYAPPRYWRDPLGYVHLEGLAKSGGITTPIFTLPPGYRPASNEAVYQICVSNDAVGVIDVRSNGTVTPQVGSNVHFSIWGVSFLAKL